MPVRNAYGHPLCKHEYNSSCTWWCTWHQFIYLVVVTFGLIAILAAFIGPQRIWQNMNYDAGVHLSDVTQPQ